MSIIVTNLSKSYGKQKALDNISLEIKSGQITGLLGPNGAGKSTLMKIITGSLLPDEGMVEVNGVNVADHPLKVQKILGYLPEHNPQYLELYVKEYLAYVASIYKVEKSAIDRVIEQTVLGPEKHKKIGALSKGYRQRVGLAAALIPDPDVLILDEPTTGLDPSQLVEIRALLNEISVNKTVLFSTHIMQEVVELCAECVFLKGGIIYKTFTKREIAKGITHLEEQFQ
ncbi:MAG TPA: gliding motility-associated ABC transporter ATP-binding subunit GldA [Cryomorphaceae bacterium]|nr:gliding motility-associated ABC transporter ATP-binding subunit GldA [Cryomorphaceae bacterium]HCY25231.1 gliding motility-associated ABC transporter ATP-binding subunit GldA [Cryomorphaceae bacterium]